MSHGRATCLYAKKNKKERGSLCQNGRYLTKEDMMEEADSCKPSR